MPPGETEIDVGSLQEGRPQRADMVVFLRAHEGAVRVAARDALTGQFVRLSVRRTPEAWPMPGVPDDAAIAPFALAPDGNRLLVGDPHAGGNKLVSLVLATGAAVPLTAGVDVAVAAFCPDGRRVRVQGSDRRGLAPRSAIEPPSVWTILTGATSAPEGARGRQCLAVSRPPGRSRDTSE